MSDKQTENNQSVTEKTFSSKRKLLKGAAAAPLLMTVASRPVLAKGICTPSAWVSGNLSDHNKERECGGRSPGYWKNKPERWPEPYKPGTCKATDDGKGSYGSCTTYKSDGTRFHDIFDGGIYGDDTMMQVLWRQGYDDKYRLGAHIVAALLNAKSLSDYGMTEAQVIDMYNQLQSGGLYTTSAGDLSIEQCIQFIQQTYSY